MSIFISWSGERSRAVATALDRWIPRILPEVKPWISTQEIEVGQRWLSEIGRALEHSDFGIVCMTPENLHAPWVMFEAGAISKLLQKSRVIPYCVGIDRGCLTPPLSQFQCVNGDENGTYQLLKAINCSIENPLSETPLQDAFVLRWPSLKSELSKLSVGACFPFKTGILDPSTQFQGFLRDVPPDALNEFHRRASHNLDIAGHSLTGLLGNGRNAILTALANGARVRLAFLDPTRPSSDQVSEISKGINRSLKEKIGESLKIATELEGDLPHLFQTIGQDLSEGEIDAARHRLQIAVSSVIFYVHIQRVDDNMLVSHYSQSPEPGRNAPTWWISKKSHPVLFRFYEDEFERIWSKSLPGDEVISRQGIQADRSRVLQHLPEISQIHNRIVLREEDVPLPFPRTLIVLPNMSCNQMCPNCYTRKSGRMDETQMTDALLDSILDLAKRIGVSHVEISGGGEPLSHGNAKEFLSKVATLRENSIVVGLLTNGSMINRDEQLAKTLLDFDYVRLSYTEYLDDERERQRKEDDFCNVLRQLAQLREDNQATVRLGVKLLLTKQNAEFLTDRIGRLLDITTTNGRAVDHIKIRTIRGGADARPTNQTIRDLEHRLSVLKRQLEARASDVQVDLKSAFVSQRLYRCWINPIMSVIDASGDVYICCNYYERPDHMRIGSLGKDGRQKFEEFWGSQEHIRKLDDIPVGAVCNSEMGCHCRLVRYQELCEPYVGLSASGRYDLGPFFPAHSRIL